MSSRFQPIDIPIPEKQTSSPRSFRSIVIAASDAKKMNFKPFVASPGKPAESSTDETQPKPEHSAHGKPTVTLERKGKRIVGIKVHCGCGEVIELQCNYPIKESTDLTEESSSQ